nr:MAG TPA: protein of unknown function (DUF4969) [Caudoviricetes sp.]
MHKIIFYSTVLSAFFLSACSTNSSTIDKSPNQIQSACVNGQEKCYTCATSGGFPGVKKFVCSNGKWVPTDTLQCSTSASCR